MLTRLEVFRVSRGIKMADLVEESGYHRSHVFRIRQAAIEPSRDAIAAIVSAMRRLSLEDVRPEMLFELSVEESGPWQKGRARMQARELAAYRRERQRTQVVLQELARKPRGSWFATLQRTPGAITLSFARNTTIEGRRLLLSAPAHAEALFDLAGKVADISPDEGHPDYQHLLCGVARLERANALRQLGQYDAALPLLEEAEGRFAGVPLCTHDLGRAWFVRGSVFFKMNGLDEALSSLRLSINIFAALDDQRRIARARVVEGNIFFEHADWDAAHERWLAVLPVFEASRDWHSLASTWLNLGWCELERGAPETARDWLTRALDRFTRLKSKTDMARTRWPLALAEARFGRRGEGLTALRREREEFERLRLLTEAGMVELDIVEMLLLERGRWADAAVTAGRLVPIFERAGAKKEALKALGYLWEATNTRLATPDLVRRIRSEVKRSEREPSYRFEAEAVQ